MGSCGVSHRVGLSGDITDVKILIVSHPCATACNQSVYAALEKITHARITICIPADWKDEFGNALDEPPWPTFHGKVRKIPVWANGNIILHTYRIHWRKLLLSEMPDVVYIHHEPYAVTTWQLAMAIRRHPSPIAWGVYSAQNILKNYPPPFSWAEHMVLQKASFALPVTDAVSEVLAKKNYHGLMKTCPLPVDPELYHPRKNTPDAGTSGVFSIGYAGRLVEAKGVFTLARALGRIKDLSWELVVAGKGPDELALRDLVQAEGIASRVKFLGYVPHASMPEFLADLDLLIVPSESGDSWKEQFGRVIVEALACGTPVLGSDSGEIPALLEKTGGGISFKERSPEALAAGITQLMNDPDACAGMAENGRQWVLKHLSTEAVAERMKRVFSQALNVVRGNHEDAVLKA